MNEYEKFARCGRLLIGCGMVAKGGSLVGRGSAEADTENGDRQDRSIIRSLMLPLSLRFVFWRCCMQGVEVSIITAILVALKLLSPVPLSFVLAASAEIATAMALYGVRAALPYIQMPAAALLTCSIRKRLLPKQWGSHTTHHGMDQNTGGTSLPQGRLMQAD